MNDFNDEDLCLAAIGALRLARAAQEGGDGELAWGFVGDAEQHLMALRHRLGIRELEHREMGRKLRERLQDAR